MIVDLPDTTTSKISKKIMALREQGGVIALGRVLTLAGLHHLTGLGVAEVLLYVEADNAPAVHVYSALGFGHDASDTHVQYAAPAGDGA